MHASRTRQPRAPNPTERARGPAAASLRVGAVAVVMRSFLAHRRTIERADSARLSGSSRGCSGAAFCAVVTGEDRRRTRNRHDLSPPRGELVMTDASGPWRDNEGVSSLSSWAWLHAIRSGQRRGDRDAVTEQVEDRALCVDCGSHVVVPIRLRPFDRHRHPTGCQTGTAVALDPEQSTCARRRPPRRF
jgi:hypothetical protein